MIKISAKLIILLMMLLAFFLGMVAAIKKTFPFPQTIYLKHAVDAWIDANQSDTNITSEKCIQESESSYVFGDYRIKLQSNKAPFAARDGAGAYYLNNDLYLVGGWNPNDKINFPKITSNDVWKSADYGISWTQIKANSFVSDNHSIKDWKGRHSAGYVVHNNEMFLIGGDANQGYHIDDIWKSKDGASWEMVNSRPPWAPRTLHLTFSYKEFIYVIGGQTMPKFVKDVNLDEIYYRDVWRSTDGKDWEKIEVTTDFFSPRGGYGGAGFVLNDEVYVTGGFTYDNLVNKERDIWTDIWKSSGNLQEWEKIGQIPMDDKGNGFQFHDMAVFDEKLWIIGGARIGTGNTNEIYASSNGASWGKIECSPLKPTHATSVFSTGDSIVITAGNGWSRRVWRISKKEGY